MGHYREYPRGFYRVIIETRVEFWENRRNAVETQAIGKCFHSFFEVSLSFTGVAIKQLDYELEISIA